MSDLPSFEEIQRELAEDDREIECLRNQLRDALKTATHGVRSAELAIGELISSGIYDIEFAEAGDKREDLLTFLSDAGRLLRVADAIRKDITDE